MLRSIREWWTGHRVVRKLNRMKHCLERLDGEFAKASAVLMKQQDVLTKQREDVDRTAASHRHLLERSEEALQTSRADLRVAEKTIESLVAANTLLTDRWEAQSAIEVRRRVSASATEET